MYRYIYYVHLFLENSSIFSHNFFRDVFVITYTITYSKKRHSLKTSAQLFWVILGFNWMEFLYLLRAVKPCLKKVCKDVFCITPMLTALIFFHNKPSSPRGHFGVCLVSNVVFFLYFSRAVWFLMKFCTYILDNTLMAIIQKDLCVCGEGGLPFA